MDAGVAGLIRSDLQIRRYPRGRPDPVWLPAWLPCGGRIPARHLPPRPWSLCAAFPPSDWLLPPYSPEGRRQGPIRVYVDQALWPVLVFFLSQSGGSLVGGLAASAVIRDRVVAVEPRPL